MELELKANKLNCNASSCSDLKIKGIAERFIANASSGSDINARNLTTLIIDTISSSGAGMVVNVLKELTAKG